VTSLSPGNDKMSKHTTVAGDASKLLVLLARLRGKAEQLIGGSLDIAVIQEAGLDGFWVHRSLEAKGIESHVVDPDISVNGSSGRRASPGRARPSRSNRSRHPSHSLSGRRNRTNTSPGRSRRCYTSRNGGHPKDKGKPQRLAEPQRPAELRGMGRRIAPARALLQVRRA
jgi:hypothetical protein